MKKVTILIIIMALSISMAFAGISCKADTTSDTGAVEEIAEETTETVTEETADTEEANGTMEEGSKVIGFSWQTQQFRRFQYEQKWMSDIAEAAGYTTVAQWANFEIGKQVEQIENLISQGVAGIILNPIDIEVLGDSVNKAKAAGIPVITYDQTVQNCDLAGTVVRDNRQVGELHVTLGMDFIGGKGNVVLLNGGQTNYAGIRIKQAVHEFIDPYVESGDVKIIVEYDNPLWDAENAQNQTENALNSVNDDIQAVICANDQQAQGAVNALEPRGLAGEVYVSGMDGDPSTLKLVYQGKEYMTVWTEIDVMAETAINFLIALIEGSDDLPEGNTSLEDNGFKEVTQYLIPNIAITQVNLEEFVNEIAPPDWVDPAEVFIEAQ